LLPAPWPRLLLLMPLLLCQLILDFRLLLLLLLHELESPILSMVLVLVAYVNKLSMVFKVTPRSAPCALLTYMSLI
jgi:hypothetical protein